MQKILNSTKYQTHDGWTDGRRDVHLSLLPSRLTPARPSLSSPAVHQAKRRPSRHQPASSSSSCSRPRPGPSSSLLSDSSITPWGGQVLYESSFTSIPPLPPPPLPPTPPTPRPTPSTPYDGRQTGDRRAAGVAHEASSSTGVLHQDSAGSSISAASKKTAIALSRLLFMPSVSAGEAGRAPRSRRDLAHRQVAPLPRLPPLRPISNLSFSRSFTFSFFELPLHHSPRCRAERVGNLLLLWRQMRF